MAQCYQWLGKTCGHIRRAVTGMWNLVRRGPSILFNDGPRKIRRVATSAVSRARPSGRAACAGTPHLVTSQELSAARIN